MPNGNLGPTPAPRAALVLQLPQVPANHISQKHLGLFWTHSTQKLTPTGSMGRGNCACLKTISFLTAVIFNS